MDDPGIFYLIWRDNACQAAIRRSWSIGMEAPNGGKVYGYFPDTGMFLGAAPPGIMLPWRLPKGIRIFETKFELEKAEGTAVVSGPGGSDFEAKVGENMAAGKSKGEAVRLVARDFPQLHENFMSALESRGADSEANMRSGPSTPFEMKVAEYMARGMKKAEAVRQVARDYPDLHAAYVRGVGGTTPEAYLSN